MLQLHENIRLQPLTIIYNENNSTLEKLFYEMIPILERYLYKIMFSFENGYVFQLFEKVYIYLCWKNR